MHIPDMRHQLFCIQYIISGHLNSAPHNARVPRAVLPCGELIQNLLCTLPHLFTVQNAYSTRIYFFNQYVMAKFGRKESTFGSFSLWNFTYCGSCMNNTRF